MLGTRLQLSDEAAARIRELIMDGRVRPGDYLRLERLALEFGISVTPVREALKSLRSEGFVVLEPRRGFVVAPLSKRDVQDLFWVQAASPPSWPRGPCRGSARPPCGSWTASSSGWNTPWPCAGPT